MAVTAITTVVHVPFPSKVQYKSLESDGLAAARLASTGDASGGNVLHTFRGQAGFLYVLRAISAESVEVGAVNNKPDIEVRYDVQWLANAAGLAQGDLSQVLSMADVSAEGSPVRRITSGSFIKAAVEVGGLLPLGVIQRTGVFDILAMNHRKNVLNNTYVSLVVFDVYRTEALTVPAFLSNIRQGLLR